VNRRGVCAAAAVAALIAALSPNSSAGAEVAPSEVPTKTPIKHFVTLMQENHSFDNYFGTYEGADGIPAGTCMPIDPDRPGGGCVKPRHIGDQAVADLSHSVKISRAQFNGGKMDGFIDAIRASSGRIDENVMGYYDDTDLPYYWNVADNYTLFDRFFTSSRGGSISNHMFWVAGQAGVGRLNKEVIPEGGFQGIETIFDRLEEQGISWKFYVQNYDPTITFRTPASGDRGSQIVWVPPLTMPRFLDDPKLARHIVPLEDYYRDTAKGTLPAVSYIVPSGSSEHPPGSLRAGETFVRTLINSLMRSDTWDSSAFLWSYDDWGGWFDHVRPPRVDKFGYGFRAPALLVSPYAKRGHIEHSTLDFTSMLRFIERNWGLEPLAERDRQANGLAPAFDFAAGPREAVFLDRARKVPPEPEPRRAAVYVAYGLVIVAFAAILAGLWIRSRPERRRALPEGFGR
jgi:phospholipase C